MHTYLRTYLPTYLPISIPTYTYIYLHTPTYITGRSSDPVGCDPIESTKLLDRFFFNVFLFVFFFKYFLLVFLSFFGSYNVFFCVFVCLLRFFFHVFLLLLSVTVRYPLLISMIFRKLLLLTYFQPLNRVGLSLKDLWLKHGNGA